MKITFLELGFSEILLLFKSGKLFYLLCNRAIARVKMSIIPESTHNIEQNIDERSRAAWAQKFPVLNQNFVVMSIVDTGGPPAAVKVFGTFSTLEEANKVSAQISAQNDFFDVFVADTDAWLPVPCSREFVEDISYQEDKMDDIRKGFCQIKEKNAQRLSDTIKKDTEDKKARALLTLTNEEGCGESETPSPS